MVQNDNTTAEILEVFFFRKIYFILILKNGFNQQH